MSTLAPSSSVEEASLVTMPVPPSLDQVFFKLSVNFLLYLAFITIFYLLVRFYLEEPTSSTNNKSSNIKYSALPTEVKENEEMDTQLDTDIEESHIEPSTTDPTSPPANDTITEEESRGRKGSFLNINEWGEPEGTRQEVLQQLLFCAVGLCFTFCIWSVLQERILTQPYDGEYYIYSYGLVFTNRLGGLILSACLMYYYQIEWYQSALWEYSIPSCANMLSSWCQYEALKYITFPTQMIAKSFKMLPTMLMGSFLHNKTYESFEFVSAGCVGIGLYLFIYSTEGLDVGRNVIGEVQEGKGKQ